MDPRPGSLCQSDQRPIPKLTMRNELYLRYRPKTLDEIVGQNSAIASIQRLIERNNIPHCILLTGPTGVGKTTIGRILRRVLKCHKTDYHEKDCTTEEKPLDFVRELKRSTSLCPMNGKVSVWFLEEFQSLARAGFSQQALLKLLEDCPSHVYFILATTDPSKIFKAIHSRATEVRLGPVATKDLKVLIERVATAEKMEITKDVIESVAEASEGSARKALVILEQIGSLDGEKAQLEAIDRASASKDEAIKLARLLLFGNPKWPEVAKTLKDIAAEDPEGIRRLIMAYARTILIGSENKPPNMKFAPRAFYVIDIFSKPFYDTQHAGLAAACWEFLNPEN
jgi:DNA polymerase III gamma/tau subunit